jgi:hypothetical protein
MELQLNMWNVHQWCLMHDLPHFYSIQEESAPFQGFRFIGSDCSSDYAFLSDEAQNTQYKSVLSFGRDKIYFTSLTSAEAMNCLNQLIRSFLRWETTMTLINLRHGSLNELVNSCIDFIPYPVWIISNARILAMSSGDSEKILDIWHQFKNTDLIRLTDSISRRPFSNHELPDAVSSPFHPDASLLMDPVLISDRYYWILTEIPNASLTPGDPLLFHKLSLAVQDNLQAHMTEQQLSFTPADPYDANEEHFITNKLSRLLLTQEDFLPQGNYTVFRIEPIHSRPSILINKIYLQLMKEKNETLCFFSGIGILMIVPLKKDIQLPDAVFFSKILPLDDFIIGQSTINDNWKNLPAMIHQTYHAMDIARQKGIHFMNLQNISADLIRQTLKNNPDLQAFVHPAIVYLRHLDEDHSSSFSYLETLKAYIISGGNLNAAARILQIHRNSVVSRIERIRSLTGLTLESFTEKEDLYLSILISS